MCFREAQKAQKRANAEERVVLEEQKRKLEADREQLQQEMGELKKQYQEKIDQGN